MRAKYWVLKGNWVLGANLYRVQGEFWRDADAGLDCSNGFRFFSVRRFGLELLNIYSTPKFLKMYYKYRGSVLTTGF